MEASWKVKLCTEGRGRGSWWRLGKVGVVEVMESFGRRGERIGMEGKGMRGKVREVGVKEHERIVFGTQDRKFGNYCCRELKKKTRSRRHR